MGGSRYGEDQPLRESNPQRLVGCQYLNAGLRCGVKIFRIRPVSLPRQFLFPGNNTGDQA